MRPSGAVNVVRRTWDKEEFEKRAKDRAEREAAGRFSDEEDAPAVAGVRGWGASGPGGVGSVVSRPAPPGAAGPEGSQRAFLSARDEQLNLEVNLNKRKLVTEATPSAGHGGYYCATCECTLKDSEAYLDHINGKRHQRKLGFSMRVEASSVDAVRARLTAVKGSTQQARATADSEAARKEARSEYESRVTQAEEEEQRRKRARRERKEAERAQGGEEGGGAEGHGGRPRPAPAAPHPPPPPAAAPVEEDDPDAAMAAMMGFTGFGKGAKA